MMNVLFVSISSLPHVREHGISLDLIHEFKRNGHSVYIVCALEKYDSRGTFVAKEDGCIILRVRIGKNKKANIIEKGLTNVLMPGHYIEAINQYFPNARFDLILYPTPPVTQVKTVKYIKNRDGSSCYLLLKDIFPQNAVDIGMMTTSSLKGLIYRYFRNKEKKLYQVSDYIGCMSPANVDYVLKHNPEIRPDIVEVCPNAMEPTDMSCTLEMRQAIRKKFGIPLNKKVFIYGGNLGRPQDIPFIIECFRRCEAIADTYFLVVGDGTEYEKLEGFVNAEKPSNVKLLKKLPKEEYDRMIGSCDVGLIFLDHRFTIPNFPSRLLSYMAAKLPVLACTDVHTDIGKTVEEGGFGWWCVSDNADWFAQRIIDISGMPGERLQAMGETAFDYLCEHYSSETAYGIIMKHFS